MPIGLNNPVPKYDVSTQTVGILYPSEKSLSQARDKEEAQQAKLNYMSDKKPVLTAISPGKGLWMLRHDRCTVSLNEDCIQLRYIVQPVAFDKYIHYKYTYSMRLSLKMQASLYRLLAKTDRPYQRSHQSACAE